MAFPSVTYTFANSTTADATQVNQNFTDLVNGMSDGTKSLSVAAATFSGTVTAQGAVTLGASSANLITFTGSLNSTINIGTTNTYDIGSDTFGLRALYLGSGSSSHSTKLTGASVSSAWTMTLPTGAGTSRYRLQTDGSGVTSWDPVRRTASAIDNIGLAASVGSNILTITLNTAAGTGSGATDPIDIVFRNATATTGTPVTRTTTAGALTIGIPNGATLGTVASQSLPVHVYAIDNAGTIELAVAGARIFDENTLQSSTSITSGSTALATLYSTTGRSNVAIRYIGRVLSSQTVAGTWAVAATEVSVFPLPAPPARSEVWIYGANGLGGTNTMINRYSTVGTNIGTAITYVDSAANGASFTINMAGVYSVTMSWDPGGGGNPIGAGISKNSNQLTTAIGSITAANQVAFLQRSNTTAGPGTMVTAILNLAVGDVIRPHTDGTGSNGVGGVGAQFRITQIS